MPPRLPDAVQRQINDGEAARKAVYEDKPEDPPAGDKPARTEGDDAGKGPADKDQPSDPAPKPEPEPAGTVSAAAHNALRTKYDELNERYSSLRSARDGRAQAAEEKAQAQAGELTKAQARIAELEQTVKALSAKVDQAPERKEPASDDPGEMLKQIEDEYGSDWLKAVRATVRGEFQAEIRDLKQQLAERGDDPKGDAKRDPRPGDEPDPDQARKSYWNFLDTHVAGWRKANTDPAFTREWLSSIDPATGRSRRALLQQADASLDAEATAAIFQGFIDSQRNPKPNAEYEKPDPPNPQPQGKRGSGEADVALRKERWTGDEITQFYRDKAQGKYSADEAKRIEREILKAGQEGRVD